MQLTRAGTGWHDGFTPAWRGPLRRGLCGAGGEDCGGCAAVWKTWGFLNWFDAERVDETYPLLLLLLLFLLRAFAVFMSLDILNVSPPVPNMTNRAF